MNEIQQKLTDISFIIIDNLFSQTLYTLLYSNICYVKRESIEAYEKIQYN